MKRFFLALAALVATVTIAWAGFNQKQNDDGSTSWVQSQQNVGGANVEWTPEGDTYPSTRVTWFDDFLGDVIADQYSVNSGTDTDPANDPAVVTGVDGLLELQSGNAGTGVAADGSSLTTALQWESNQDNLVLEAKCQLDDITGVIVNIGFTDVLSSTLELPLEYNTTTITSTATDAVAFVFDTGATTDNWHLIGVANGTDTAAINTGLAPVAATYQTFKLVINASETAQAYINGTLVGAVPLAVTGTVDLTPILVISADTTDEAKLTCDYIHVGMDR